MKRIAKNLSVCQTFDEAVKAIVIGSKVYVPRSGKLFDVTSWSVPDIKEYFDSAKIAIVLTRDGKEEVEE